MDPSPHTARVNPLTRNQIDIRLKNCPRLPSLSSINSALRELLNADQRYTSQISDVIRRDPSLTARLLRLVNSVYYGLTSPVNSIEEAVFYLGVRQIRQLAMVTPVIEDFQRLTGSVAFPWREFWRHCIGVAIMTREVLSGVCSTTDEADYVAGLVHDVGKIVMAAVFPLHFSSIHQQISIENNDLIKLETETLGMNHQELGALYLKNHNLSEVLVTTTRCHHDPGLAGDNAQLSAAVQIADLLVRHAQIGNSGNPVQVSTDDLINASGWNLLYPGNDQTERSMTQSFLKRSMDRLPTILEGLV